MILRPIWAIVAGCTLTTLSRADISVSIDILDGSDPGGPAPAGLVVVDIGVDVTDDDLFFSGGIYGDVFNGAQLVYGQTGDPNFPVTFRPPGLDNRFVSFGSAAYGRNATARFAPAGTVAEQTIALAGRYIGGPIPVLLPRQVNVGFWATPPASSSNPDTPFGRDGYVMRLVFDITNLSVPGVATSRTTGSSHQERRPPGTSRCSLANIPNGMEPASTAGTLIMLRWIGACSSPSPLRPHS